MLVTRLTPWQARDATSPNAGPDGELREPADRRLTPGIGGSAPAAIGKRDPVVRDLGLLQSALARPQASAFGEDAYPSIHEKAASLLHSLARNHALVDGNKRLALAATVAFLGINGLRLTLTNDEAHDLVIAVATGALDEVAPIAAVLAPHSVSRASTVAEMLGAAEVRRTRR